MTLSSVEYPGNRRHITEGNVDKLAQLTVNNPLFRELAVSKESRDHQLSDTSIDNAKVYFAVDDKSHHFLNHFRLPSQKIKRLGCTLHDFCGGIKNKLDDTAKPPTPDSNQRVLQAGISKCADILRPVVVGPGGILPKDNECHMRTALLTDVISRQLGKIKACDDIEAGQQLTHTLNWIDTVLASDCLTGIGVGGALKAEKKEYDANPDSRLAAARTPFVRSTPEHPSVDTSGGQKSPSGSSKLPGLNTVLPKIRSELQALQVEMALNYCATTASTQTSNAKAMISQLDTIKEGPIKLTEGSNLSQTQYAAARICQDMNDALAAKITQIQQNLADFKTWSNDYKEASNALVTLCGGVNECYKSDRGRSDWVGQIKGWHEQYKHVRKPNAEGCLDMGAVEFSKLLNNLNTPKISRSDWVYHAFTVTSTLSAMLSGDPLPESHPQPIKEEHTDFLKRKADDVAFKRKVDGQCHALSARIEFSRDRVGENMAQIGVINLCDTTSAMLDHIEKKGSQSADDIRTIRSAMKNALATTQEIGSPSPEQTSKTAALVVKVDGALKHLMDFFDVNMFNAHRSEIRDIYTNHLKTYAYFDHPQTQAITNNVTNILRNEDFQKNIRAHIQAHGLTVAQLATQQPNTVSTGREAFV